MQNYLSTYNHSYIDILKPENIKKLETAKQMIHITIPKDSKYYQPLSQPIISDYPFGKKK